MWVESKKEARSYLDGLEWSMCEEDVEEALKNYPEMAREPDSKGNYLLWDAIDQAASLPIIQKLVDLAPEVLAKPEPKNGQLPLTMAITEGRPSLDVIALLAANYPKACYHVDKHGKLPMEVLEEERERNPSFYREERFEKVKTILQSRRRLK